MPDQFSFGSILYELVSGHRAWRKGTAAETLVAIMRDDPPSLSSVEPPVPPPVRRIIEHCLAKDPQDRYASTRDLAGDVRYAAEHPSDASWGTDVRPAVEAPPPRPRRVTARTALLGVFLAALVVLGTGLWLRWHGGPAAIDSLAVLPFENGTREPDSDYLSDGITESLIDQMSRVRALRVMARATVFRFKGSTDPREAGRKLGVGAVLTGRISRRESRLSISAELVDVASGARLWGEKYDRPFTDLLRVQDEIASDISGKLRLRLTEPEKRALGRHGTENTEAYELFLKARYFFYKDTEEGYLEARRLFTQAVEKDPMFAEAYSMEGQTYGPMVVDGYTPPTEGWSRQDAANRKALDLSPGLLRARFALAARRFWFDWDFDGAEGEFRELVAKTSDPGSADFRVLALLLWSRGRTEEALAVMEKARRLDPGNLAYMITTADYLKKADKLEEAAALYRAALADEPSDPRPLFGLAEILRRQGDVTGAIDALRKAYELSGEDDGVKALASANTEKDYENAQVAVARARLGDLEKLAKERYVSPLELARLEAQAGEREKAFSIPRGGVRRALQRARPSQSGLGVGQDPRRRPVHRSRPPGRDPLNQGFSAAIFPDFARRSTASSTASRSASPLAGDFSATPYVLRAAETSWRDAFLRTGRMIGPAGAAGAYFATVGASAMSTSTTPGALFVQKPPELLRQRPRRWDGSPRGSEPRPRTHSRIRPGARRRPARRSGPPGAPRRAESARRGPPRGTCRHTRGRGHPRRGPRPPEGQGRRAGISLNASCALLQGETASQRSSGYQSGSLRAPEVPRRAHRVGLTVVRVRAPHVFREGRKDVERPDGIGDPASDLPVIVPEEAVEVLELLGVSRTYMSPGG